MFLENAVNSHPQIPADIANTHLPETLLFLHSTCLSWQFLFIGVIMGLQTVRVGIESVFLSITYQVSASCLALRSIRK